MVRFAAAESDGDIVQVGLEMHTIGTRPLSRSVGGSLSSFRKDGVLRRDGRFQQLSYSQQYLTASRSALVRASDKKVEFHDFAQIMTRSVIMAMKRLWKAAAAARPK